MYPYDLDLLPTFTKLGHVTRPHLEHMAYFEVYKPLRF